MAASGGWAVNLSIATRVKRAYLPDRIFRPVILKNAGKDVNGPFLFIEIQGSEAHAAGIVIEAGRIIKPAIAHH